MPRPSSRQDARSLDTRALEVIRKKYKIRDPHIVDTTREVRRTTQQPIYRFQVVSKANANGPQHTVVLDHTGVELDLAELRQQDHVEYFAPVRVSLAAAPAAPLAAITISPTENKLALRPGDTSDEVITVVIPANSSIPKADVYFLADTTGSMGSILSAVQGGANNVLTALNGLGLDFAFGVGNYKDFPNDPYAFQHQLSPTNVAANVTTAISAWSASGGNDTPEGDLFALDRLAESPGGGIGWRSGSKRIVVWFGDAPGHDPVCPAIAGLGAAITEASATAKLVTEKIIVLAISTATPGLDDDPKTSAADYAPTCGAPGGAAGQGTRIASATGGQFVTGINPSNIVTTIINLVKTAVSTINNVSLLAAGGTAPFVTAISPAGGYGPLAGDIEHKLKFEVRFTGVVPCQEKDQVFTGTLDVVVDGTVVTRKRVEITVPACPERHSYSVKFVCGRQPADRCDCAPVRPGIYATEINIHNYQDVEIAIEKRFVPVVWAGVASGREPRVAPSRAEDKITLPPHTATMDDCCRITELLFGGVAPSPVPLTIGFLEIISDKELSVTAVYTVSDLTSGAVSIAVEQIAAALLKPA